MAGPGGPLHDLRARGRAAPTLQALAAAIEAQGEYLGDGIVRIDALVNHRIDPALMAPAGDAFVAAFAACGTSGVTKVLTVETGGIVPAWLTANALGVPLVYARKRVPVTMRDALTAPAVSRTGQGAVTLAVSARYIEPSDRVLVIDDFLGSGRTLVALAAIVAAANATLVGVGCLVEKAFETPGPSFAALDVPVVSLVRVDVEDERVRANVN